MVHLPVGSALIVLGVLVAGAALSGCIDGSNAGPSIFPEHPGFPTTSITFVVQSARVTEGDCHFDNPHFDKQCHWVTVAITNEGDRTFEYWAFHWKGESGGGLYDLREHRGPRGIAAGATVTWELGGDMPPGTEVRFDNLVYAPSMGASPQQAPVPAY